MARGGAGGQIGEYLDSLGAGVRLSGEEERAVAERAAAGDADARDRLVRSMAPYVVHLANKYRGRFAAVPLPDLVQAGNLGVMRAVAAFDPALGLRLCNFAHAWIYRSFQLERPGYLAVSPPGYLLEGARSRGGVPIPAEYLDAARRCLRSAPFADFAAPADPAGEDFVRAVDDRDEAEELARRVAACLREIPPRCAEVLRRRYGLGGEPETLPAIGADLGVSGERVRVIQVRAERQLRATCERRGVTI